jgi:regulator of protease activity HflC (stomatin/prohibitin superfamily)
MPKDVIIKPTHRGLRYEDGRLSNVLEAGRYQLPDHSRIKFGGRQPVVEIVLVDMREQELVFHGEQVLSADRIAVGASVLTLFHVVDPVAAMEKVISYQGRLDSDVQFALRRTVASMTLDEILSNRNRASGEIHSFVTESAIGYGVQVVRSDIMDLTFPGTVDPVTAAPKRRRSSAGAEPGA